MTRTICIYCGARTGSSPIAAEAAAHLGRALVERGWNLLYGGGSLGLMGVVARSVLEHGGHVIGVIPQALMEHEIGLLEATELVITRTLYERKATMDERSDAFVVLPGGFGTLDELMEMLTLRQLGYNSKPIIILNLDGYYDPLFRFFQHAIACGYLAEQHITLYQVATTAEEALRLLDHMQHEQRLQRTQSAPGLSGSPYEV